MHGQSGVSQEWSVHAQVTISHHQPSSVVAPDIPPPPAAYAAQPTTHDSPGVHMRYSWGEQPTSSSPPPPPPPPPPQPPPSLNIPRRTCYGFQRGNILFTTRPPPQEPHPASTSVLRSVPHLLDSGYSSEQVSPGSYASLPTRRSAQPYNRRCKSTCSIVLSGAEHQGVASASMRPNVDSGLVGYDLGCSHRQTSPLANDKQGKPRSSDFEPVPGACEVCGGGRSPTAIRRAAAAANTFTTHFCTHVPERLLRDVDKSSRDVASQTSDNLTRATSAGKGETSACRSKPVQPKMGNKVVYGGARRKTDSELLQVPVINVPEPDTEKMKPVTQSSAHGLTRSPARLRGQSPLLSGGSGHRSRGSQCMPHQPGDMGQRKPRTVHIDVYCTGSEDADASGSSDYSEEVSDSWSSPQTVFESEKLRVVHARVGKDRLPEGYLSQQQQLQQQQQQHQGKATGVSSRRSESFKYEVADISKQQEMARGYDSDDGLSSLYPSQISATETSLLQSDVTTSASRNSSWSTLSSSSMALSNEYDSAAATSWKDTVTELDSLVHSTLSLAQSDSFEYADAADRLRIRQKERAWASTEGDNDGSKTWKSPHVERKHLLQEQKFREFLAKRLGKSLPLWKTETTENSEDDDDDTGDAWSFCGRETELSPQPTVKALKREDTVKKVNSSKRKDEVRLLTSTNGAVAAKASALLKPLAKDNGSLSDSGPRKCTHRMAIGPFGYKAPSPSPSKLATSVTSPFTNIPGKRTEQLCKAEKFGKIVGTFLKPGHHVGPSKNPECACEHCRKYYEDSGYRTRTRSVGDVPLDSVYHNWKKVQPHNCEHNSSIAGRDSDVESSSIAGDVPTDNAK